MQNWRSQNTEKNFESVKSWWLQGNGKSCENPRICHFVRGWRSFQMIEFPTKEPRAKQEQEQELCPFLESSGGCRTDEYSVFSVFKFLPLRFGGSDICGRAAGACSKIQPAEGSSKKRVIYKLVQIWNEDKGKHPWEASAGCQVVRPGNPCSLRIWDSSSNFPQGSLGVSQPSNQWILGKTTDWFQPISAGHREHPVQDD